MVLRVAFRKSEAAARPPCSDRQIDRQGMMTLIDVCTGLAPLMNLLYYEDYHEDHHEDDENFNKENDMTARTIPSVRIRYAAELAYRNANPDKDYVASKSRLFEERCLNEVPAGERNIPESVVKAVAYQALDSDSEEILLEVLGLR